MHSSDHLIVIPPANPNASIIIPAAIIADGPELDSAYPPRPHRKPVNRGAIVTVSVLAGLIVTAGLAYGALWMWVTGLPMLAAAVGAWFIHLCSTPWVWLFVYWVAVGIVYAICRFGRRMHQVPALLIAVLSPMFLAWICITMICRSMGKAFG
ncbi:hypothetical protein ACRAWC_01750 [Leifsonia sp. L25]|uniref:hypothetical protein n=1 Tax=Actinomycetes TaxID=1760 RepID=UPI003D688848